MSTLITLFLYKVVAFFALFCKDTGILVKRQIISTENARKLLMILDDEEQSRKTYI